jgi:hypothetical protein
MDCLENQLKSHYLCDKHHERWVETRVQALLTSADDTPMEKVGLRDIKISKDTEIEKGLWT